MNCGYKRIYGMLQKPILVFMEQYKSKRLTYKKRIRVKTQYGDLFDEEEFRQVYSLTEDIRKELESGEPNFEKINSWFKKMNSNAKLFETNLSIANKELKKAQRETEILNSSLGRFIQFYSDK